MGHKSFMDRTMEAVAKIAGQRHVMAIRDGFIAFMPFLIIGSLFIILQDFLLPGYYEWIKSVAKNGFYQFIILPRRFTYDIMSLFVVMFIANRLVQPKGGRFLLFDYQPCSAPIYRAGFK